MAEAGDGGGGKGFEPPQLYGVGSAAEDGVLSFSSFGDVGSAVKARVLSISSFEGGGG